MNENYWFWIKSLSDVIFDFADAPENVIHRIGEKISVPEDLMNELDHWYETLNSNEITIKNSLSTLIQYILTTSNKYDGSADEFWTNQGFHNHPDWLMIRNKCREYIKNTYF